MKNEAKPRRRRRRGKAPSLALFALSLSVVAGPLLIAGARGWGITIIAALAGGAAVTAAWHGRFRQSCGPLAWVGAAFVVLTILQATPLPRWVTDVSQPQAVQRADEIHLLLGNPRPGWVAHSLAPHATWTEALKGLAVVASFCAAWLLSVRGLRRSVARAVALAVVVAATAAALHALVQPDRVFGLYAPLGEGSDPSIGPILNRNHLSGFLAMGVPLLISAGFEADRRRSRLAWWLGAIVLGGAALAAVSKGGVLGLVVGASCLGALALRRRRGRRSRPSRALAAALGLALAATLMGSLGLYVASEGLAREFEQADMSKLELAGEALGVAMDYPWLGLGRGAFSVAFVGGHGSDVRYLHPENFLAQWATEWGIVPTLILLGALASATLKSLKEARSWTRLGALAAFLSIAVHELVDFATELVGIATVAAAVAGAALAPSERRRPNGPERTSPSTALPALAGLVAIVAALVFGWRIDSASVPVLRRDLEAHLLAGRHDRFRDTLDEAVALHPSEPIFPLLAGSDAVQRDDPAALAWLNQAMRGAPGWPGPRAEAARFLVQRNRFEQAFLEVAEAERRTTGSASHVACAALVRRPGSLDALIRALDTSETGTASLSRIGRCLPREAPALPLLDEVLAERGDIPALVRMATRELPRAPSSALRILEPVHAAPTEIVLLRARALVALDRPGEAVEELQRASRDARDPRALLFLLAEAQADMGDGDGMRETLQRLRGLASGHPRPLAAVALREGRLELGLGHEGAAMRAFERAHRLDPTSDALVEVARLSEQLGDRRRAFRAYSELCRRRMGASVYCDARDRLAPDSSGEPRMLLPQPNREP